jgi:hypothetical protein
MAPDYEYMKKSVRKHKSNLTRAQKSGDPNKVIGAVDAAFKDWDDSGNSYPDQWHNWKRAKEDAEHQIRMGGMFNDRRR